MAGRKGRSGGRRIGAGRPTLFPGKTEKVSYKLTRDAVELVRNARDELLDRVESEFVTASDAAEYLMRKGAGLRVDI